MIVKNSRSTLERQPSATAAGRLVWKTHQGHPSQLCARLRRLYQRYGWPWPEKWKRPGPRSKYE